MSEAPDYAFPHSDEDESRRLQLLEQRLDPLTKRRIQRLGVSRGARSRHPHRYVSTQLLRSHTHTSGTHAYIARRGPAAALSQGRSLLRQVHQLGLAYVGADAEIDIIQAGTDLAEFYQLSQAALALPTLQAGALSLEQATAITDQPGDDDFLACGFVHIGVWGQRPRLERP